MEIIAVKAYDEYFYLNSETSTAYLSIRGFSRLVGRNESTIRGTIKRLGVKPKNHLIPTPKGLQQSKLLDEVQISKLMSYYGANFSNFPKIGAVYVFEDSGNNAFKIGFTTNLVKRQADHKTSNPFLELVAVFPNVGIDFERNLHSFLKPFRIKNSSEWYVAGSGVLEMLECFYIGWIQNKSTN